MISTPVIYRQQKWSGIKDDCDVLSTKAPYLRVATNVDIDDAGDLISLRDGFMAEILSGAYHSLWNNAAKTRMLGVLGTELREIYPSTATTRTIRSGLTAGRAMDYVEVAGRVYYSNGEVYGVLDESWTASSFPSVTKFGSQAMPAGSILEFYNDCMYSVSGGHVSISLPMDFGRTRPDIDFMQFPGAVTLFRAVTDGIFVAYDNTTTFLLGSHLIDFNPVDVADYGARPRTAVKFDASLVSSNVPLQGNAVYWVSSEGLPCIGYPGGRMINYGLTKKTPISGSSGASVVRKNSRGAFQALTILQT